MCLTAPPGPTMNPDICFDGGPIQQLNFKSGPNLNIFLDMKFECNGRVTAWTYYAQQPGQCLFFPEDE